PRTGRDTAARGERYREEEAPRHGIAYHAPKTLVLDVLRAQQVAVRQNGTSAVEFYDGVIRQQGGPGLRGEARPAEKIPIAVHEIDGDASRTEARQSVDDGAMLRCVVVVAEPDLEQVAQDVERRGDLRRTRRKALEQFELVGPVDAEMQIGDE